MSEARVKWLLNQLAGGITASDEDLAAAVSMDDARVQLDRMAATLAGVELVSPDTDGADGADRADGAESDGAVVLPVKDGKGRYWLLHCRIEDSAPHRLTHLGLQRTLPPGMEIRFVTPDDNEALVEISRRTAIVLRNADVIIDPGDDYFVACRLMQEWIALVATDHDKVVAVQCATARPAYFGGEYISLSQVLHTRVLPEYSGLGLWSMMQGQMLAAGKGRSDAIARGESPAGVTEGGAQRPADQPMPTRQTGIAYVNVENDAMKRLYSVPPWHAQPFRVTLPCAALARYDDAARVAGAGDVDHITEVVNACHAREELFYPYTATAFAFRMERAPDLYSWGNVLVSDDAVLGVWHSPETRIRTADGVATTSRRALVLDYGFAAGAEDAFERLLRHACARAAALGYDHLSIFSSDASRGAALLTSLADGIERYDAVVPFASEPEGAAERGIYTDQVYF